MTARRPSLRGARPAARAFLLGTPLALALSLSLAACSHPAATAPSRIAATDAIVRVKCSVADAGLWLDGRFIGAVGELHGGIALAPGAHRLELRDEAYFVHYQELDLAPAQRLTITVELAPILP